MPQRKKATAAPAASARVAELVEQLTIDEKAAFTAGADVWHLPPIERLGIGALKMSDGPSGVRGERVGTRRSLSFPCGTAVGATWDEELAARYGTALGDEARSKGVHLLLGPTVCIPRTPVGGRTFESFAEDPHLSSRLTVAYVAAVQARGVGCCVKHFACNDQEHERMTISVDIDERTLREVHLASFEAAVQEAGAWSIMSAYNRLHGTYCGEHPELLGEILKGDWGFDGVVVSDWFGTHSTVDATVAGLDIEMPGPAQFLGSTLAEAVRSGEVDEAVLDDHAVRILTLIERVGLLDNPAKSEEAEEDSPERRALAREIATSGTVLLQNSGVLPLQPRGNQRVAVIGPNAARLETGGGGSSSVSPLRYRSLVGELRERLGDDAVVFEEGYRLERGVPPIDIALVPGGLRMEYFEGTEVEGSPVVTNTLWRGDFIAMGDPEKGLSVRSFSVRATGSFVPDVDGTWTLGVANAGRARVLLDGNVIIDNTEPTKGKFFYGRGSDTVSTTIEFVAGEEHEIVVELAASGSSVAGFQLGAARPPVDDALECAVAAAAAADVAVVVVGSNRQWETEGADRHDLHLPGEQDELVRAIAAANPNTVVVVNAGAPTAMPWADAVGAILMLWYPGEEGPAALADVLVGAVDPGGRLPLTFPVDLADSATHDWYPGSEGVVTYGERLLIGYRHFDANKVEPAFAFGHGLSYTTFEFGEPTVSVDNESTASPEVAVRVPVTNTGHRAGREVVQLYVESPAAGDGTPLRTLQAFGKVALEPGETATVELVLGERSFARWDEAAHGWTVDAGSYGLAVGASSRDLRHRAEVTLR